MSTDESTTKSFNETEASKIAKNRLSGQTIHSDTLYVHLHEYNFSANATTHANVINTLNDFDNCKAYIGPYPDRVNIYTEGSRDCIYMADGRIQVDPRAFVDPNLSEIKITEEYLNTNIVGKKVYSPLYGSGHYLYTGYEWQYLVLEADDTDTEISDNFKRVEFGDEETITDLYCHNWWYSYNYNTDTFIELTEAGKINNLMRYQLQLRLTTIIGTAEDRLADYGRLIAFLFSKVELTDDEKALCEGILENVPDTSDLAAIADKEKAVRDFVKFAHNNPVEFANHRGFNISE